MMTSSPIGLPQPPTPRRRRRLRAGWVVVGLPFLGLVAALLIVRSMSLQNPLALAVVGLTPFFALPLTAGIISSWLSRSNLLRALALVVAGSFVYTTSPVDAIVGCRSVDLNQPEIGDPITIYTANTLWDNPHTDEFAAAVVAADADIVVMQEVRWAFRQALQQDPRLDYLAHRSSDEVRDDLTTVVWSRWAFTDLELVPFEVTDAVRATVDGPSGPFTIYGLHTFAPLFSQNVGSWERQLAQLGTIDQSTPHVLAGDFNATSDHRQFRELLATGWTDVHDRKGCGLDNTWPVNQGIPVPPLMRLDHVLVSDHFDVLAVEIGHTEGSDHDPVIATITMNPQP